jgi:hypothetical protein
MKTAKEMFEELGYRKMDTSAPTIAYVRVFDEIWFNTNRKTYSSLYGIGIDVHKAIHQQMKELGWLDE